MLRQSNMSRQAIKKPVLAQAADLLARQEHSSGKLREKLRRRGYEEIEIDTAIEKLTAAHYLNDEDACQRAFTYLYNEGRLSVRKILLKLSQRGFERELINDCIPEDITEHEVMAAVRALRSKFRLKTPKEKMQQFLYMHGFGGNARRSAIEQYFAEMQEKWERENDSEE